MGGQAVHLGGSKVTSQVKGAHGSLVAGDVISGGNFHGQPLAMAVDELAVALATLGGISERRIAAPDEFTSDMAALAASHQVITYGKTGSALERWTSDVLVDELDVHLLDARVGGEGLGVEAVEERQDAVTGEPVEVELERRDLGVGLATLCVGGGMGIATIIERV